MTPSPHPRRVVMSFGVMAGILLVAGFMAVQFSPRASAPSKAAATATAAVDYGAPPPGVRLIWVHDPKTTGWLIGYDWTGRPRGTVKLDPALTGIAMAPDGQSFSAGVAGKGGTGQQLDRLGHPLPTTGAIDGKAGPVWADDSRHLCGVSLDPQTLDWTLITVLPGQPVKQVVVLARDVAVGQSGIRLASCSFGTDRAIAVRTTIAWPAESWVVRLSDGKVLNHSTYERTLANIIASPDSRLVAENSIRSTGPDVGTPRLIIRRVSDGSVVASLDPQSGVLAFSGDGSMVLLATTPWFSARPAHLAVLDLQSGSAVWRYDGPEGLDRFLAQPGGSSFALALTAVVASLPCGSTPQTACSLPPDDSLRDVLVIRGDGEITKLPGRFQPTW